MSFPRIGAIDCDVHPAVPGMRALLPYLDDHWREQVTVRGIDGLDPSSFPVNAGPNCRADWRADGVKPGSSLERLRADALDAFGSRVAICNCLYGAPSVFNADFAAALARAINDWLAAEWLDREPRLRGSIVLPIQDPELAVAEIERRADDPRFVQVLVPAGGEAPLGRRFYWPIFAAAEKHRLPLCIHAGSTFRHATTSNGWPSYYLEDYVTMSHAFQAQLLSLVAEGVFTKFPGLTVVLAESGFTWLPQFMWRQVKTWRAMRAEIPWVDRAPAEIIRDHVRITLQPTDVPPDASALGQVIDMIGTDRFLLFSTDYPHWQFDGDEALPPGLSESLVRKVLVENPLATYPRLKESVA
ncbi:MAG TPA: amidohydrolase family protein [Acetobacteraceae bacterium]|nr:amidohydrolase family protein [Acetobacteraceae bacterium]